MKYNTITLIYTIYFPIVKIFPSLFIKKKNNNKIHIELEHSTHNKMKKYI